MSFELRVGVRGRRRFVRRAGGVRRRWERVDLAQGGDADLGLGALAVGVGVQSGFRLFVERGGLVVIAGGLEDLGVDELCEKIPHGLSSGGSFQLRQGAAGGFTCVGDVAGLQIGVAEAEMRR